MRKYWIKIFMFMVFIIGWHSNSLCNKVFFEQKRSWERTRGGGAKSILKPLYLNDYAELDSLISYIVFLQEDFLACYISTERTSCFKPVNKYMYKFWQTQWTNTGIFYFTSWFTVYKDISVNKRVRIIELYNHIHNQILTFETDNKWISQLMSRRISNNILLLCMLWNVDFKYIINVKI